MGRSQRTGRGSAIYLGKPIAVPPGVCIGLPGPTFFGSGPDVVTAEGLVVDLTNITLDLTALQVTLD